jgi:enoyl-CoA hydratase
VPGEVLTEARDGVLVITLNRPKAHNVIDQALTDGVLDAIAVLDGDDSLRVGILTGSPTMFCAGLDLKYFAAHGMPVGMEDVLLRRGARKPLVAAIEGVAFGGGLELAMIADVLVAANDVKLGQAEVRYGLFPTGGALLRLPAGLVREMVLTGLPTTAERALQHGLVHRLTEPGRAFETAFEIAAAIASNPPGGVQAAKHVLDAAPNLTEDEVWDLQQELAHDVFASDDGRRAVDAFVNRR